MSFKEDVLWQIGEVQKRQSTQEKCIQQLCTHVGSALAALDRIEKAQQSATPQMTINVMDGDKPIAEVAERLHALSIQLKGLTK